MQIQIDWFQVYFKGLFFETNEFIKVSTGIRSKIFANIDEIHYKGRLFGFLCFNPLSRIIPNNANILKVDNSFLYDEIFENVYYKFSKFCGLKYHNITRIDLCTDFNYFLNFRDPENFIRDFFSGKFIYPVKTIFKIIGRTTSKPTPDYLRYGSNLSEWSVYLYRKSLEMKQVKFKQWIYDQWKQQKIDVTKDVWRLEFTLKGGNHSITDKETGECIKINDTFLFSQANLYLLFNTLLKNHFTFKIPDGNVKISLLESLKLFDLINESFIHYVLSEHQELNRSQKIFIKQLEKLNSEVREYNTNLAYKIMEISAHVAKQTGLEKYRQYITSN